MSLQRIYPRLKMATCLFRNGVDIMSEFEILTAAIRTFGEEAQEGVAVEECAELIQAISHKHRGREHNVAEEIADVEIMLEQLKIINDCREEVAEIHKQKIDRLYQCVFDNCL